MTELPTMSDNCVEELGSSFPRYQGGRVMSEFLDRGRLWLREETSVPNLWLAFIALLLFIDIIDGIIGWFS